MNNEYTHNYNTVAAMKDLLNVLKSICKHNQGTVRSIKIDANDLNTTFLKIRKSFNFWVNKYRYKNIPGFMDIIDEYAKVANSYIYNI